MQSIILSIILSAITCQARPWNTIPTQTASNQPNGLIAEIEVKPTPFINLQHLEKRVFYPRSVCGFIGGDVALPASCSSNSVCLWDSSHTVVGCSPTGSGGTLAFYTACVDGGDDDDDDDGPNPWVFTCTGSDECYQNTYDAIDGTSYFQYGCGRSSWATTVLTQPRSVQGQSAEVVLTVISMTDPPPQPTSSSSSSSSESSQSSQSSSSSESQTSDPPTSSQTSGSPTNTDPSNTSSAPTNTNTSGSSTPIPSQSTTSVGAIAGGVVGGVLGLALIGAIFFFARRKRQQHNRRVSEAYSSGSGPQDMGEVFEPKELDSTGTEIPSELPGDSPSLGASAGPAKPTGPEPVELPGSMPTLDKK